MKTFSDKKDWDTCKSPTMMLVPLLYHGFDKQIRLFAYTCIYETPLEDGKVVRDLLTPDQQKLLEVAKDFAEGKATTGDVIKARKEAWNTHHPVNDFWYSPEEEAFNALVTALHTELIEVRDSSRHAAAASAKYRARYQNTSEHTYAPSGEIMREGAFTSPWKDKFTAEFIAVRAIQADLLRKLIAWEDAENAIKKYEEVKG